MAAHYTYKLPAFSGVSITKVTFKAAAAQLDEFVLKWRIRSDDSMVPPQGLAFIKFRRLDDGTHAWSRWHLGQKAEEIQGIQL